MPIYAFECGSCGHQFERLQRLADADPTKCPECHAEQVRRQLTAPSFRLAGAGWYETDFKKDGDKKRNLAEKGDPGVPTPAAAPAASKPDAPSAPAPAPSKPEPGKSAPAATSPGKPSAD
jgi:putative FmdB family regulatory protein